MNRQMALSMLLTTYSAAAALSAAQMWRAQAGGWKETRAIWPCIY